MPFTIRRAPAPRGNVRRGHSAVASSTTVWKVAASGWVTPAHFGPTRPWRARPSSDLAGGPCDVAEGNLQFLTSEKVADLGSAAGRAAAVEAGDAQIAAELRYWTGHGSPPGTGLPAGVLLDHPTQTTVPSRDFGRAGTLPVGAGHDWASVYALLFGDGDGPRDWLRAGEALSAAWLTATTIGVSVVPLNGVVEAAGTWHTLRRLLAGLGHPYLALRLGIADPEQHGPPPRTPRLPLAEVVDTSAVRPDQP